MVSSTTDRRIGLTSGTAIKAPCRAATTAAITLSGLQTIDGVACITGDRVLVKNQSSATDNGIYDVDTGTWTRSIDFESALNFVVGTLVYVNEGTTYGHTMWRVSNATVATLAFEQTVINDSALVSFTQSGTGAVSRTVQERLRDSVSAFDEMTATQKSNVRSRSLTVGVSAAVQAACDYLGTIGGGYVDFPMGSYLFDAKVTPPSNVILRGANREAVVIYGTINDYLVQATVPSLTNGVVGITFSANGANTSCVDFTSSLNGFAKDCHFQNLAGLYGNGLTLQSGAIAANVGYWCQVTGNMFNSLNKCINLPNGDGTWGGGNDAFIAFNTFSNTYNYAIYSGLNVSDVLVLANDFAGGQTTEIYYAWFGLRAIGNKFENNSANSSGYCIQLAATSGGSFTIGNRNTGVPTLVEDLGTTNTILETVLTKWPVGNADFNIGNLILGGAGGTDASKRTIEATSGYNLILKALASALVVMDGDAGVEFDDSGVAVGYMSAGGLKLVEQSASSAADGCMFVDSADHILKFKDGSAVVHALY